MDREGAASGIPLLTTKLHPPRRRRGVVPRERLGTRLADELPAVVVVSAPAGFGKSTLLTEWLADFEAAGIRTAWLSLDRRDSDPAVFWTYVLAALRSVDPDLGAEARAWLGSAPADPEHVAGALVNDLAALGDEVVLVLDDYHAVESLEVHESVRFLVDHLPANAHLVVAGRADPPWPLGGLRARGELVEVRAADLRFTTDEAAVYLNDAMGLALAPGDVGALEDRTEGWIAALQLAALSLQGRTDPEAFIGGFAGDDRFVVDYLVDEVLDRQPADLRTFLLETSILHRLSAPLCAAVTGRTDARAVLDAVERANLFLVALDDQRRWFRFHHLFGDVLRARLLDERPEAVADLHRRAADWFEADGDRLEAIGHAMTAGDTDRAAALVELAVPDLRQQRQEATQRVLLDALPEAVFADRPVLAVARIADRMVTGDVDGIADLLDAAEAMLERREGDLVVGDHEELRRLPTQLAMYRAALALVGGDLAGATAHAERAAERSADDDHFGRGAAAALVGLARWNAADLVAAEQQYVRAIAEFRQAGYLPDILGCSLGLADMQVARGHLAAAEQTLRAAVDLAETHGPLRGTADVHLGLAEVHLERNELDAARARLRASLDVGDRLALPQHAYRWRVMDGRLRAIAGDLAGALVALRDAEAREDTDYFPRIRPVSATIARVHLAAGDLARAQAWADDAGLDATDEPAYLREYEHLTLVRLLLAQDRHDDASALLERLLPAAEAGGRLGSAVEAEALLALAHQAAGRTGPALLGVAAALARAERERFVRVFLDLGAPMVALLEAAVRSDRSADLAAAVLAAGRDPLTATGAGPPPQGLVDELSARELDVLRLLRTELSGPEIAAELVVSLNTVRSHTKSIFSKLGVNSRRAAVRRADELGL